MHMKTTDSFGKRLQALRLYKKLTQQEFAELVNIPQPSISAYENGRNSPNMDVLINIAQTCNVSLDWLCGLSSAPPQISTMGDIANFLYTLLETDDIHLDIDIHDKLPNDLETDTDKYYARITIYGNDFKYPLNNDLCSMIRGVRDDFFDFENYFSTRDSYEQQKSQRIHYHKIPLKKKEFPELSHDEKMKKRLEALESHRKE